MWSLFLLQNLLYFAVVNIKQVLERGLNEPPGSISYLCTTSQWTFISKGQIAGAPETLPC